MNDHKTETVMAFYRFANTKMYGKFLWVERKTKKHMIHLE